MAQDLTLNVKTTSDVPQAMEKAKTATTSFSKQLDDIGKKYSTAFKDIALSFVAPMVILNNLIGTISSAIEQARRDAQEGFDLIAKGDTKFASSQQKKQASYVQYMMAQQEEQQKVKAGAQIIYEGFLNSPQGKDIFNKFAPRFSPEGEPNMFTISTMASNKDVRDAIEEYFKNSPEFQSFIKPDQKPVTDFKGPQGFSNVVGVGANPVVEAMTMQLDEQRKHTDLLQQLVNTYGGMPSDFTKQTTAAPSRASLITK